MKKKRKEQEVRESHQGGTCRRGERKSDLFAIRGDGGIFILFLRKKMDFYSFFKETNPNLFFLSLGKVIQKL